MIIFACDPGGTTGWASWNKADGFDGGQLGSDGHHIELWNLLSQLYHIFVEINDDGPMYVISESFEFRNNVDTKDRRKGLELISRDYIGIMKLFASLNANVTYIEQMPAHAKSFITDEKLERMDLIKKPKHTNRHEHDALRHLLFFMVVKLKMREGITDKWKKG